MSEQHEIEVQSAQLDELSADPRPASSQRNLDLVLDIPVPVTVELGRTRMTVEEMLQLHAGAVIELDRRAGDPIDVFVNGKLVARGEIVVVDETFAVRVTSIVGQMQRIRSLEGDDDAADAGGAAQRLAA